MSLEQILERTMDVFMSDDITGHSDDRTNNDKKEFCDSILVPLLSSKENGVEYSPRYQVNYTEIWNTGDRDARVACMYYAELDSLYLGLVGQKLQDIDSHKTARSYTHAAMISLQIATNIREMIGTEELVDLMKLQNKKIKKLDRDHVAGGDEDYIKYTQGTMIQ